MNELKVITEQKVLGKSFRIYGDFSNPLFLAKDVAEWIEHSNSTEMLRGIDEDEKLNSVILSAGQRREVTMLTEYGLYEVLMQSRKPIAKQFKKKVKEILKEIRTTGKYEVTPTLTRKTYMGKTVMTIRDLQDLSGANNGLINHCVKMSGDDWRLLEYQRMINFNEQNNNQYPQVQSIIIFGLATALKVADMLGFTDNQIKAIFRYFEKPVQQNIHLLSDKEQQKAKPVTLQEIDIATKILAIMPDSQFKENACHTLLYDVLGQSFFRKVDFLDTIQAMAKELGGMTKDEITASINSNVTQDVINSLSDRGKFLFQRQLNISSSR